MEPVSSGEGCSRGLEARRGGLRKHRRGTEGDADEDMDSPGAHNRSWWKELVEPPAACSNGRRRQGNRAEVETESDPDVEALPAACASMAGVPRDGKKSRGKRKNLDDCDDEEEAEEEEEMEERRRRCNNNNNRKKLVRDRGLPLKRTQGDTRMGRLLAAARPRPPCPCPGLRPPDGLPLPPGRRASAPQPPPHPPPPPLTSAKVRLKMWGRGRGRVRGSGPWERGKSRPPGAVCRSDAQTQTDEGTPSCSDPSTSESSADQGGPQPCSLRIHTPPAAGMGMGMGRVVEQEGGQEEEEESSSSDSCTSSKDSSQRLVTPAGYPRQSFRASAARLPSLCDPPPLPTQPGGISGLCPGGRAGIAAGAGARGRGGQRRRRMASPADNRSMCYTDRSRRRRMNRETNCPPQDFQENWSCLIF